MTALSPRQIQSLLAASSQGASYLNSGQQGYLGNTLGAGANAAGVLSGLEQGGVGGYGGAALNAGNLYGKLSGNSTFNPYTTDLGAALGLYGGIEEGGVAGGAQAALSAGRLGLNLGAQTGEISAAEAAPYIQGLGYAAIPLELYNFGKNWQSGNTGSDALSGAETGASIGSVVGPIGTIIGGVAGGALGALSSAFGGGRPDPETENWDALVPQLNALPANEQQQAMSSLSPSQAFQGLAGVMDAKNDSPGSAEQLEQLYGRMGENNFLNAMGNEINTAYGSGQITSGEDPSKIYSGVITPWLASQGVTIGQAGALGQASGRPGMAVGTNQQEGPAMQGDITDLIGDYVSGQITPKTPIGIQGQTDSSLPNFAGNSSAWSSIVPPPPTLSAPSIQAGGAANLSPQQLQMAGAYALGNPGGMRPPGMNAGGSMRRKRHFDDGGDVQPVTPYFDQPQYTPPDQSLFNDPSTLDFVDPFYSDTVPGNTGNVDTAGWNALAQSSNPSSDPSGGSSPGSGATSLANLLKSFGLSSSTASTLGSLGIGAAELAPILASIFGGNSNNATPPPTPAGYGSIPSIPTPSYSRSYSGPTSSSWTPEQWYTYGQGPEQNFFSNNQLPNVPGMSPPSQQGAQAAPQGSASPLSSVLPYAGVQGMPMIQRGQGRAGGGEVHPGEGYVDDPGFGDGTSDDINAKLSGGEYVMDGGTVSMLGNGSNEAGARRLDQLRDSIRRDAGKHLVKGKQFMHAKEPEQYLRGRFSAKKDKKNDSQADQEQ